MKKISIKLLAILFLATMIFACGNNSNNNTTTDDNTNSDSVKIVNNEVIDDGEKEDEEVKIDFSKFEHYATILTKADLIAQFGEDALLDGVVYYAEGTEKRQTTTLTNKKNENIIRYVWDEDNSSTSSIEASYNIYDKDYAIIGTQKVVAENGLSTGMSLSELRTWNGADFKFSGFGWDFGGGIYSQEDSKIFASEVLITLDMLDTEGFDFANGDVELMADDSRLIGAKIIISNFSLFIEKE